MSVSSWLAAPTSTLGLMRFAHSGADAAAVVTAGRPDPERVVGRLTAATAMRLAARDAPDRRPAGGRSAAGSAAVGRLVRAVLGEPLRRPPTSGELLRCAGNSSCGPLGCDPRRPPRECALRVTRDGEAPAAPRAPRCTGSASRGLTATPAPATTACAPTLAASTSPAGQLRTDLLRLRAPGAGSGPRRGAALRRLADNPHPSRRAAV